MNSQELRSLQEAYNQVYDESYKDLGDKARNRGQRLLNKSKTTATRGNMYTGTLPSNTPEGEKLQNRASQQFAASAFHNPEKAQAKAAANKAKGENKKKAFGNRLMRSDGQGIRDSYEYDLYDIILSHLLDEGYTDTEQAAEAIMVNMSEDWRESIVEEVLDEELSGSRKEKASEILNKKLRDVETLRNLAGRKRTQKTDYGSGNKAARKSGKEVKDSRVVQSDN